MADAAPAENPESSDSAYEGYYTRQEAQPYGSLPRLRALAEGYFGLFSVFILNVLSSLAIGLLSQAGNLSPAARNLQLFQFLSISFVTFSLLSYRQNKKIAFGMNWPPAIAVVISILMGLNSTLCCGAVGYFLVRSIASGEMRNYGIVGGGLGLKKYAVMARIEKLEQATRTV